VLLREKLYTQAVREDTQNKIDNPSHSASNDFTMTVVVGGFFYFSYFFFNDDDADIDECFSAETCQMV
jgi:hypothetical protein